MLYHRKIFIFEFDDSNVNLLDILTYLELDSTGNRLQESIIECLASNLQDDRLVSNKICFFTFTEGNVFNNWKVDSTVFEFRLCVVHCSLLWVSRPSASLRLTEVRRSYTVNEEIVSTETILL